MRLANVIDMQEFKSFLKVKRTEEYYGHYLKTLADSQLETEIGHLLGEFSGDHYDHDFHSKGKLILKEITSRIQI